MRARHPDIETSRTTFGAILVEAGRCEEAMPILERAVRGCVESLGWDHDHTGMALANLASGPRCLGDYKEAKKNATRAAGIYLATQGADSGMHGTAQYELALIVLQSGRQPEADSLEAIAVGVIEKMEGREGLIMSDLLEERAIALRRIRQEAGAAALEDSVRAIRRRWLSRSGPCVDI